MASAAEQLVASFNWASLGKAEDLKRRIWFTLGALLVYRLGTYIPLPGINPVELAAVFQRNQSGILGMFNMFSGGAVGRLAIFALGIMPYISASIIIQLLTSISPTLEALKKEGESGRKKINQYTRYGTVILAAVQAYAMAVSFEAANNVVLDPGPFFRATTVITLVGGTMFLMWLGEQITARGVGNGISLIIFAGIVAELPAAFIQLMEMNRTQQISPLVIISLFLMAVFVIAAIVFMERAQRRLLIQYPKRQVGNRMAQGDSSHLPLKLNMAGVIPPIFASSLLLLPLTIAQFSGTGGPEWLTSVTALLGHGQPLYIVFYIASHRLLLLLLHGRRLQSEGDRRQPQEVRRLHPRHPPGREDRRVHRLCVDPHHRRRRHLHRRGLRAAGNPDLPVRHSVLLRRHLAADRRQRDDGYRLADPEPSAGPPV